MLPKALQSGSIMGSGMVSLTPYISGEISLSSDQKTLYYTLDENLQVGETYELRVAGSVLTREGVPLGKDHIRTFHVVSGAKVQGIFPSGSLDNLSQNITVIFNVPMIQMTNLDTRDTLPCPLKITPNVVGKCVWTSTSILEFLPEKPLE